MTETKDNTPNNERRKRFYATIKQRVAETERKYSGRTLKPNPKLDNPIKQSRNNSSGRTCLVATTINAMKALGCGTTPNEDDLFREITANNPVDAQGEIGVGSIVDYLAKNGFAVQKPIFGFPNKLIKEIAGGGGNLHNSQQIQQGSPCQITN